MSHSEPETSTPPVPRPVIARAQNDLLIDDHGRQFIDLFSAHGTTWLGHSNKLIADQIAQQLSQVWITGGLGSLPAAQARESLATFFPPSHHAVGLYSTGMEAAEFAIRFARVTTGKNGIVGFQHSMHGKSMATAQLCWDNHDGLCLPNIHRLPFGSSIPQEQTLARLHAILSTGEISAVFFEPLQASNGAHQASPAFYNQALQLCRQSGALSVFDEILTGFHRTGPPFYFSTLDHVPDLVLVGKSIGNGFPVSAIIADRKYPLDSRMFPGSTFSDNPLAATAVIATLKQMRQLDMPRLVGQIEQIIADILTPLREQNIPLRGRGALWIIELPPGLDMLGLIRRIYERGVFVSFTRNFLRLLPAATIDPRRLHQACTIVKEEVLRANR